MRAWLSRRRASSGKYGKGPSSRALVAVKAPPVPGQFNQNPAGIGLLGLLAEDFETYGRRLHEPGLWAVAVHRLGNARMDIPRPFRAPLSLAYHVAHRAIDWGFGIDLCYSVRLGRRVRLWHHGGMVLGARAIGDDVHIRQNTTFGVLHRSDLDDKPTIGDRVDIGAGACLLGGIAVGHDSLVGANSVVVRDVPPFTTVFGVPARPAAIRSPDGTSPPSPQGPPALRSVKPRD